MPKRHGNLIAMGIRHGLMHTKRHLAHFLNSSHVGHVAPLKHLQITEGSGAQRRRTASEEKEISGEGMHKAHRKVKSINFKF